TGDGIHYRSGIIDGLYNHEAILKITKYLEDKKIGSHHVNYKLRDWVFSRQRYWGEPFPVLFDEKGKIHLLKDDELPLLLPELDYIKPSGTGESPLALKTDWVNVIINHKKYRRETNTMPQLAGSSWYQIAYVLKSHLGYLPFNSKEAKEVLDHFLPVDLYVGGTEHAVGHLLYSRFWYKVFYDLGLVSTKEPFLKLINQGMILGDDHSKMSKSKGNTVSPDQIYHSHGADSLRLFEMFLGPLEADKPWSDEGLDGAKRFLDRVHRMFDFEIIKENLDDLNFIMHQTIKKVTEDYEKLAFNTAISQMMVFVNEVYKTKKIGLKQARIFLQLLNPIAPHLTEEINKSVLGNNEELVYSTWPSYDEKYLVKDLIDIPVQVNGRLRAVINVSPSSKEEDLINEALNNENVKRHLNDKTIIKKIVIPKRLINFVVK
ncbi:MAG: class I tRNA ligase family protein, partial [Acholeplasmataceae bacterium]